MTVNQAVYGAPDTWLHVLPYSGYNSENKNFVPAWQSIAGGISANKVNDNNPLDNSICYASIAEDSPAAGVYLAAGNNIAHPTENKPFNEDFFISTGDYSGGTSQGYYDIGSDFPTNWVYCHGMSGGNMNALLKPLCSSSLKDLVMVIYVEAYDSTFTTPIQAAYNSYKQLYAGTYPNVVRVYGVPFARAENGIDADRFQLTNSEAINLSGFARMGIYEAEGVNEPFYDYSAALSRSGGLKFHIWGMPSDYGREDFYNSANYVYKGIGSGGEFVLANNGYSVVYTRPWGAPRYEHAAGDWVRRAAASYGIFFVDRLGYASGANAVAYRSENMYLGTIDEQGLCHGDYTTGEDNASQPQYSWLSTNESTYDPSKPLDTSRYDNTTVFYNNVAANNFTRRYVLSEYWLETLSTELWQLLQGVPAGVSMEEYCAKTFLTNNPIDCIISLKKFPLAEIEGGELEPVHMGAYTASTAGRPLANLQKVIDFTFSRANRNSIYPVFDNTFLDYEPYTTAALVIPFCGSIQLPLAEFLDKNGTLTITVKMVIDYVTGAVTAYVLNNGKCLYTSQGNCSIDLPVSGIQSYTLDGQIFNANQSLKLAEYNKTFTKIEGDLKIAGGGIGGAIAGAKKGGPFGAVAGAFTGSTVAGVSAAKSNMIQNFNVQNNEYNIEHIDLPMKTVGSSSAVTSNAFDMRCKIIIERPEIDPSYNAEIYADTIGHACIITDTLENFSGFTKCAAVNLDGVPCTAEEKTMINNALLSGAYL